MIRKKRKNEYDAFLVCDGCAYEQFLDPQKWSHQVGEDGRYLCSYCQQALFEAFYNKPYAITPRQDLVVI